MAADDRTDPFPTAFAQTAIEQQHRTRNLIARVRSVLRQMAELEPGASDFAAHLEGRLGALWRAEEAFANKGFDLELLLMDGVEGLSMATEAVGFRGPTVLLDAKTSEVVILAVHELATNAIKFGALSQPAGRVDISWRLSRRADGQRLLFTWVETGVPIVAAAPRHEGFGHDLITRRIAYELGGTGALTFGPGGVTCRLEIPLKP